jgi:hypothetical protein
MENGFRSVPSLTFIWAFGSEANTCSVVHKPHTQSFAGPPVTKLISPLTYLANISTIVGEFWFLFFFVCSILTLFHF